MPLPWVRLDANIGTHDKILELLGERDGAKAFVLYICALGYAGGHGTDGQIPKYALVVNHGSEKLARLLIAHRLWEYNGNGSYQIRNWEQRQELSSVTDARSVAARKAACRRWHGEDCHCWEDP
jgi:hypothetical protein